MRLEPDYQVEVTGRCSPGSLPALAGQPDPLTVGDAGRNGDLQAARAIRAGNLDPAMHAQVGLLNGQLQLELLIGPGDGAPVAPSARALHPDAPAPAPPPARPPARPPAAAPRAPPAARAPPPPPPGRRARPRAPPPPPRRGAAPPPPGSGPPRRPATRPIPGLGG